MSEETLVGMALAFSGGVSPHPNNVYLVSRDEVYVTLKEKDQLLAISPVSPE